MNIQINKIRVPSIETLNPCEVWLDGKIRIIRGFNVDWYFIKHETKGNVTLAMKIEVPKGASYPLVIDAAERAAYNIKDDREANFFTASLNRKYREDKKDKFVIEHDKFIDEVKAEIKPLFKEHA